MTEDQKITRALSQLNKLTKEGKLNWSSKNIPTEWYLDNAFEKVVNPVYDSQHDNRYIRLFKYIYRTYTDEDSYYPSTDIKLGIIDVNGNLLWEFPSNRLTYDLYETIRYKLSGVDNFVSRLAEANPEINLDSESDTSSELPF